jgi:phosphomevalonate kinase
MTARAGIDWDTPEHARIAGLAERFGGAAKPSGAGGGDVAVALLPDDDARLRFTDACRADGLVPLQARITGPPHCAADASPARYDGA